MSGKFFKRQGVIGFFICLTVTLVVLFAWFLNIFVSWENKFYDYKFLIRGEKPGLKDIVIIGIDDASIEKLGRWPWRRSVLAKGLDNLKKAGVKAIALDIIFPEPSRETAEDIRFAGSIADAGSVIGALYFDQDPIPAWKTVGGRQICEMESQLKLVFPIPLFKRSFKYLGFTNSYPDKDGILRSGQLIERFGGKEYYSLNVLAAGVFKGTAAGPDSWIPRNRDKVLVNYRGRGGKGGPFTFYSFEKIYDGGIPAYWLKDKIVLIGSNSLGAFDHYPTPFTQSFPGVEYHATLIDNLLTGEYIRPVPGYVTAVLIILFGIGLGKLFLRVRPFYGTLIFLLCIGTYFGLTLLLFGRAYIHVDYFSPSLSLIGSFLGIMSYRFVTESREKAWIKKTFSYYLSPDVIKELTLNPEKLRLGGERKDLTVLFSDIRGFTTLSEKLDPEEVTLLLNEYLSAMTEIVFSSKGTLDKFIGDAVMAFWGAPVPQEDHARRAVFCAIEMVDRLGKLQEVWRGRGDPVIDIGIGINTGEMIVGNMGSKQRMDYTVIGDNVNLASRLESLNKEYNTKIIISESTYELVRGLVEVNPLGESKVKGKERPVVVYEVLKRKDN